MKKRSVKLVDFTRENASIHARRDGDKKKCDEQASISTVETDASSSAEQAHATTYVEPASASTSLEQTSASTSLEQSPFSTYVEPASASTRLEQASASKSLEQASASKSLEQASASTSLEQVTASTSLKQMNAFEQLALGIYVPPAPSTLEEQAKVFSEQPGAQQLKRLFSDFPRLSFASYVNFGNLFTIAQRYVEFRAIVRLLLLLGEALPHISRSEQRRIMTAAMKVEQYINEVVEYADKAYDPNEIDALFCHIGCRLDSISNVLQKTNVSRHPLLLIYGLDVYPSRNRRDLVLREKNEYVDEHFLKRIGIAEDYLRTRLDTKTLLEISRDHPELAPSIETALNVHAAMKYLTYPRQLVVFKVLFELQENIKKLVGYKRFLDVDDFERCVPDVISNVGFCLKKLLDNLRIETRTPRPSRMPSCEPCISVSEFVKDANVKPEEYKPVYPHAAERVPISYANIGINQGRFQNLESLFHHLTALKGAAYKHTLQIQRRIDWFAIARQYRHYKGHARSDLLKFRCWKDYVFWRLVEAEEVMVEARALRDRIRGIRFTRNETLSDCIALSGELELLASEVDDYLTSIPDIIEDFVKEWQKGVNLNLIFRRRRFMFLTRDQSSSAFFYSY